MIGDSGESPEQNGDANPEDLTGAQALFLHERLIENALGELARMQLFHQVERRLTQFGDSRPGALVGAYEAAAAQLLAAAQELDVVVVRNDLRSGQLVTLTQDFYIRRDSEERGSFKARLSSERNISLRGTFSTARLVGATGQSETFGHKRFSMLAYVGDISPGTSDRRIELRPLFIGWRLTNVDGPLPFTADRREVWPQEIDQFEAITGERSRAKDRAAVQGMPEAQVKAAFATIIGEPFLTPDWGGETSDLSTTRLTRGGKPLSAAIALKGPGLKGTLQVSGMGKNGDQAIRLAHESVDLYVVQHHGPIAAAVRNLLSALARSNQREFMVIDGETTALILREYGMLPQT